MLTFDGKGIVMLPGALRPATAKAAAAAEGKLATRLSPGEKNGRKRMAELACVYDAAPVPRTPEDIISTPAQKRKKKKAQASTKTKGKGKPREPQARGKWLTASVTDDIPAVIAAAFDEAERRDPQHKRDWVVLVDGNNTQIEAVTAEAARRGVTVTIVIDFIHVLEYLWKAAWSFFDKGEPAAEEWVAAQARTILHGKAAQVAAGIRRRATTYGYSPGRARRRRRMRPLPGQQEGLPGLRHRPGQGLAHRHRDHRGRLQAHRQGQNGHNGRKMGHSKAPRPSSSSAPSSPTATSTTTGASTSAASTNASTTPNTATASSSQRNQLTSKEPHPSRFLD